MRKIMYALLIVFSVLLCIASAYSLGYTAAIKDAELTSYIGPGYEITFGNQTHYYE